MDESKLSVKDWVKSQQGKHLCQCGCGKEIQIKPHHHTPKNGIPKYINGHYLKSNIGREKNSILTKQRYIDDPNLGKRQSNSLKQFYLDNPKAKEKLIRVGEDNGMYGTHRIGKDAPNYKNIKIIGKICEYCGNIIENYSYKNDRFCSYECMGKMMSIERIGLKSGSKHWNWQGGISSDRIQFLNSHEYKQWRTSIFERDNYTCQQCNIRGGKLNSHHILPYRHYPEFGLRIENGITLCEKCHKKTFGKEYEYWGQYFDKVNIRTNYR